VASASPEPDDTVTPIETAQRRRGDGPVRP